MIDPWWTELKMVEFDGLRFEPLFAYDGDRVSAPITNNGVLVGHRVGSTYVAGRRGGYRVLPERVEAIGDDPDTQRVLERAFEKLQAHRAEEAARRFKEEERRREEEAAAARRGVQDARRALGLE